MLSDYYFDTVTDFPFSYSGKSDLFFYNTFCYLSVCSYLRFMFCWYLSLWKGDNLSNFAKLSLLREELIGVVVKLLCE